MKSTSQSTTTKAQEKFGPNYEKIESYFHEIMCMAEEIGKIKLEQFTLQKRDRVGAMYREIDRLKEEINKEFTK